MKTALIIPTYNAEKYIKPLFDAIATQKTQPDNILVIDSSSKDKTVDKLAKYPHVKMHVIPQSDFDHGGTRQLGTTLIDADIYIYMTQDAIPATPNTFTHILECFQDPKVGCAYGRQLPHKNADVLAAHARVFNYPKHTQKRTIKDRETLGIRTCANSNSFSAYRKTALDEASGFPSKLIVGEDVVVAGNMLLKDWHIIYCGASKVYHSHNYSGVEEFRRYFDIGAFHINQKWLLDTFKSPNKEGFKFLTSEIKYCFAQHKPFHTIQSIYHTGMKFIGYFLGKRNATLPLWFKKKCSMHSFFWKI